MVLKIHSEKIPVKTSKRIELVNITEEVRKIVRKTEVKHGFVNIFCSHTTMGLYINEDEPNLRRDVEDFMEKLAPVNAPYQHNRMDNNAHAHLRAILLGHAITIPVIDGELELGTWQSIFCAEFDGPRRRSVTVQVVGE